jgi:glycosyltransferase involved in cell wall biosynthesis
VLIDKKWIIVGGVPNPVGGVTVFVYRLCKRFPKLISALFDPYFSDVKSDISPVTHVCTGKSIFAKIRWIFRALFVIRKSNTYFNFSSPRALIYLFLFPKAAGAKWIITLHHGVLVFPDNLYGRIRRYISRLSLRKIDRIGVLNKGQREFFEDLGLAPSKLFPIFTFLMPPSLPENTGEISSKRSRRLIVASGFGTDVYRHDWTIKYLEEVDREATAVFCLYGEKAEQMRDWIVSRDLSSRVRVHIGLASIDFLQILVQADVYARPNSADSVGVAVWEALVLGVPVVASDVCDRPNGTIVFPAKNQEGYFSSLLAASHAPRSKIFSPREDASHGLEKFLTMV